MTGCFSPACAVVEMHDACMTLAWTPPALAWVSASSEMGDVAVRGGSITSKNFPRPQVTSEQACSSKPICLACRIVRVCEAGTVTSGQSDDVKSQHLFAFASGPCFALSCKIGGPGLDRWPEASVSKCTCYLEPASEYLQHALRTRSQPDGHSDAARWH